MQSTFKYTEMPVKRALDIIFTLIALAVFAIPSACIALLLIMKEKHSVFFRQERVGEGEQRFHIIKFQTMVNGVPTDTGKILRRCGVDEWPQFINVLKGEMSIVGPRALTFFDIQRLGWDDEHHKIRWSVKPGITGFAQIYGGQHRKSSWFWDKHYIQNSDCLTDVAVIGVSFLINIFGKTRIRKIIFQNDHLR